MSFQYIHKLISSVYLGLLPGSSNVSIHVLVYTYCSFSVHVYSQREAQHVTLSSAFVHLLCTSRHEKKKSVLSLQVIYSHQHFPHAACALFCTVPNLIDQDSAPCKHPENLAFS